MVIEGKSRGQKKDVVRPSPVSRISNIGSLKRFRDRETATLILHQVAKLVGPILHENRFTVGTLCEMYPKNGNLLGLNVNKGQKILLRLRLAGDADTFYPLGDIVGTMLHELTHNVYGQHDAKFYKFLDGLKERFEQLQSGKAGFSGYVCVEEKLGSRNSMDGYKSIRQKRIQALGKPKFIAEARVLGTSDLSGVKKPNLPQDPRALRRMMLEAAERRARDSKWCHSNTVDSADVEPVKDDIELVLLDENPSPLDFGNKAGTNIIDLTSTEAGSTNNEDLPIVVD